MLFNSIDFAIFFPVVVFVYWLTPSKYRVHLLLSSSFYFYMSWSKKFGLLLAAVILVNYFGGLILGRINSKTKRRLVFSGAMAFNFTAIFLFKYYNFFVDPFVKVLNLESLPLHLKLSSLSIPIGVSFYTLQAISYIWDVFNKKHKEEKNIIYFGTYISFFPQLIAGPIERSEDLIPQLKISKTFDYQNARDGLLLMLIGFFKKIVVADQLAIIVNRIFDPSLNFTSPGYVIASVLFVYQIYCDFSGYSDIAIGASKVFGLKLSLNFDRPLIATSVTDFWRKWHISLSTWINDYVFYRLASSFGRYGKASIYFVTVLTFLIVGLWHGANLTFVLFGLLHGVALALEMKYKKLTKKIKKVLPRYAYSLTGAIYNFTFLTLTCIFFRAQNIGHAKDVILKIIPFSGRSNYSFENFFLLSGIDSNALILATALSAIIIIAQIFSLKKLRRRIIFERPFYIRWIFYFAATLSIYYWGVFNESQFLYFQF